MTLLEAVAAPAIVDVNGTLMVRADVVLAALEAVDQSATAYAARRNDMRVGLGTRLVEIHADGMREAADLFRAILAATPEEETATVRPARWGRWAVSWRRVAVRLGFV
ncbi:hypothetical protein [Frankia sp. AgW1.1]|uniref:hypothetical protein n=1 Tax=Frankia sp. AgW1.1 TaxID=1836971 RepID=UPI0019325AE7|nr:hypothetical protein [Frankia sp. AgW1.1]MBL7494390.1 hypothetical protein [Frankia sp. AgW1.1]